MIRCSRCGREIYGNETCCPYCWEHIDRGAPRPTAKQRKKPVSFIGKLFRWIKRFVLFILILFGIFAIYAILGDREESEYADIGAENTAAPTAALAETPDPTPEQTPKPEETLDPRAQDAAIIGYAGSLLAQEWIDGGFKASYAVDTSMSKDEIYLYFYLYYDYSWEVCKAAGLLSFVPFEETLRNQRNILVTNLNDVGMVNYDVLVLLLSSDGKTIMSCSENGIDYNIK